MEKLFIKNRKDQNISVLVEVNENQKGLAFVMHGLSGHKNQTHIRTFSHAFKNKNFTVVSFDTTNSTGESDGALEDATLTNYYEDLEDLISWAKDQNFYQEPFYLAGHSLGGISISLYAEKFPEQVKGLIPASTVVSGELSRETHLKEELENWEKTGIREWESSNRPGFIKRLKWNHFVDRLQYNLLPEINNLTMPVLFIVGSQDKVTPVKHQQVMFDALPTERKELHIVEGAEHSFKEEDHLKEIGKIISLWLDKND